MADNTSNEEAAPNAGPENQPSPTLPPPPADTSEPDDEVEEMEPIQPNGGLYIALVLSGFGVTFVTLVLGIVLLFFPPLKLFGIEINIGFGLILLALGLFASMWFQVKINERVSVSFFGIPLKIFDESGPKPKFPGMSVGKYPKNQQEFPMPPRKRGEEIEWNPDAPLRPGYIRPVQTYTLFKGKKGDEHPDDVIRLFSDGYVFVQVQDPFAFEANTGSIGDIQDPLKSVYLECLNELTAQYAPDTVVSKLKEINGKLDNLIRRRTRNWGLRILRAGLTELKLPVEIEKAMARRNSARFDAQAGLIEDQREADGIRTKGSAAAASKEADLRAEAEGRKARHLADAVGLEAKAKAASQPGAALVLASQGVEALAASPNAKFFYGTEAFTQPAAAVGAIAEALKTLAPAPTTAKPEAEGSKETGAST